MAIGEPSLSPDAFPEPATTRRRVLAADDAVIEKQPARTQRLPCRREIVWQVIVAHVLAHADAHDVVEGLESREGTVIAQLHRTAILQSFRLNPVSGPRRLRFTGRDA